MASKSRVAAFSRDERVENVIARIATKLRLIRGPLPPVEFDAVAHDIVLDVARFVLEWAERGRSPPRIPGPRLVYESPNDHARATSDGATRTEQHS